MNCKIIAVSVLSIICMGSGTLNSQSPQEKAMLETLQGMKKANADLIEQQKKSLEALEKIDEAAKQLKIFGKRG